MPWFFIILFLTSTLNSLSKAGNLPSAVVMGTVSCDTCFEQVFTKKHRFIRGAFK
uniref:Uncharacterized protein n=1 Tax=Rhizophora mucronata TaxID=61149 RepID=A0A2P2JNZ8_RHIMU